MIIASTVAVILLGCVAGAVISHRKRDKFGPIPRSKNIVIDSLSLTTKHD